MLFHELERDSLVFIDANIFVYHFSKGSRFNPSCTDFFYRVEKGELQGITSTAVIQETSHRLMMVEASSLLDIETKNLPKYLKGHPEVVKKLRSHIVISTEVIRLNVNILSIDIKTIEKSQQMKTQYGFLSNDALTLQVMKESGIINLASNDTDFNRVKWLKLYQPSPTDQN